MYLVITREEDRASGCRCCSDETVDVFCTLLQKAGKVDVNELRKRWLKYKDPETIRKYFMLQKNITANFTVQGKIRSTVFQKEFKKRNVSFTTYLTTYAGFKKVSHVTATDMEWY